MATFIQSLSGRIAGPQPGEEQTFPQRLAERTISLVDRMEESDTAIIRGIGVVASAPIIIYESVMQNREESDKRNR